VTDGPVRVPARPSEWPPDRGPHRRIGSDPWLHAYAPHLGEVVHAREQAVIVAAVDEKRQRALLYLDDGSEMRHVWESFSMIRPLCARLCRRRAAASNPLSAFVDDQCHRHRTAWIVSAVLWEQYQSWCASRGCEPVSRKIFGRSLALLGLRPGLRWIGPPLDRHKVRYWAGITLMERDHTERKLPEVSA
jgi:hypothetical protein